MGAQALARKNLKNRPFSNNCFH